MSKTEMTIQDIENLLAEAQGLIKEIELSRPEPLGKMNLLEVIGRNHWENLHSKIISFLLSPAAKHKHPEYGEMFLEQLKEQGLTLHGSDICDVKRESPTADQRRVDIVIWTDKDVILIENKVYASDLENQVADYVEDAKTKFPSTNIVVVFLTLDGREVSDYSLDSGHANELLAGGRLLLASYADTMLPWLQRLTTRIQGEEALRSAIIQYIDTIQGLCGLREESMTTRNELLKHLVRKYDLTSQADFRDVYDASRLLVESLETIHLIKAILEIHRTISDRGHKVVLTAFQNRFEDKDEWVSAATTDRQYVGLEVPLEGPENMEYEYGLAIEFTTVNQTARLRFGVMGHGRENDRAAHFKDLIVEANPSWVDFSFRTDGWWWTYTAQLNWAVQSIFATENTQDNDDILATIAKNWFSDETIKRCRESG
jgi:hypothetical protein